MATTVSGRSLVRSRIDIWLPASLGVIGLVALLFLAERNPTPSPFQLRVYLTILALSAAAFAALIPGLLQIDLSAPGLIIRAAGAIAVFALVFFYEPAQERIGATLGIQITPRKPPKPTHAAFFDDFSENKLNPSWKILNPNPNKTTLQPEKGTLLIVTEKGSIAGTATSLKNQYVLDLNLPKGNYEVIAKASLQIQSTHNSISVGLFKDHENFLELIYWGSPMHGSSARLADDDFYRTVSFVKEELGQRTAFHSEKNKDVRGPSQLTWHFVLKFERKDYEYTGYFAPVANDSPLETIDQVHWKKLGTHAWINFDGKLSLWASNGTVDILGKGAPPEVAAEFDFVLIREK